MRQYEFWYNWEYARAHNPTLMCIGTTGGFGAVRSLMGRSVSEGNRDQAEECFWALVDQTIAETQYMAREEMRGWRTMMQQWLESIYSHPCNPMHEEIAHFVRPKWRTPMMQDTHMDLYPDNMVVPIVGRDIWEPERPFVQRWAEHIRWCLGTSELAIDPMEYGMIY